MTDQITNDTDILDSRDIIARIEELEDLLDPENDEIEDKDKQDELREELETLQSLAEEASMCADWPHGEALISDDYFTEYAEQLCKDIGDLPSELPWYIESNIDWKGVAAAIQQDYHCVDFDGVTYWIRA